LTAAPPANNVSFTAKHIDVLNTQSHNGGILGQQTSELLVHSFSKLQLSRDHADDAFAEELGTVYCVDNNIVHNKVTSKVGEIAEAALSKGKPSPL
jgi:hypothetical protein